MSRSALDGFLSRVELTEAERGDVLSGTDQLLAFAASRGLDVSRSEAEAVIREARERLARGDAEELSDDTLDLVSGAGPRRAHFS